MQEAAQHNTNSDCWIVIDGKVYDVSSYLGEHTGGDDVLLAATGKDATDDFEDAGHSKDARELLQTFCIGELDPSAIVIPELEICSKEQPADYAESLKDLTKQYWAARSHCWHLYCCWLLMPAEEVKQLAFLTLAIEDLTQNFFD